MNDTKYDEAVKYITSLNNSVNIVILIAKNSNNPTTSDEEKGSDGMNGDFFFDNFDDFNPWAPLRNFSDRAFAFINKDEVDWSQYLRQILRDIQNRFYLPQLK